MPSINCFKAYDVRGRVPEDLNEDIAYRIGRAYAAFIAPKQVAVGYDIRESSPALRDALSRGLTDSGVDVMDIGMGGTELIYFATAHYGLGGGLMVTASHNPPNYNGIKMVREESRPLSSDNGLEDIRALAEAGQFSACEKKGQIKPLAVLDDYQKHILNYVTIPALKPLKIVVNAGNGGAGPIVDRLEPHLPFEFIKIQHQPDGRFPHGVPNPMLEENRAITAEAVVNNGADLGIAWDGDYDRCFLFDEQGTFIEGYYIVGLLAAAFLAQHPGSKIIHDPRLTWNTLAIVEDAGGIAVESKSGHAFIKDCMRQEDAIYGGEMSAHHYFRDFAYADSGMIPWLLVTEIMSKRGAKLSELVGERMQAFPSSGEINRRVEDVQATIQRIEADYASKANTVSYRDGLSAEYTDWRFNLRASNTEPLIRLNVESRGDPSLMAAKTEELLDAIGGEPG
jgi:phosphomannomutase